MKLEKLKGSKFEAFKENEIQNAFKVVGGDSQNTTYKSGPEHGNDSMNVSTDDGYHKVDGKGVDYHRTSVEKASSSGLYTDEGDITKSPGFDPSLYDGVTTGTAI